MTVELSNDNEKKALIELAVDSWRFSRLFLRVLGKLDAGEASRYVSQYKYYLEKLEQNLFNADLRLVNLEGQPYDTGMAVSAVNMEDFSSQDSLFIEQMLEPIIMGPDGIIRSGTVILGKVKS